MGVIGAAPLVLLIVVIRPFIWLRFGNMISQRIGHFAIETEAYLCARDRDNPGSQNIDIMGCPEPVCNRQLKAMWARTLRITPGARLWSILDRACRLWTRGDAHHAKLDSWTTDHRFFFTTEPHLSFTNEEHQRGRELLEQLAIPAGAPWICIHNRDSAYLEKTLSGCWSYHDYRDFSVQSMVTAAEGLSNRGYYVVRMGAIVAERLISNDTKVIDYASSIQRSDFADIYLSAKCLAYIGSDAGIACVPLIFRKPVFYINFAPVMIYILTHFCPWPFIMKRPWHKKQERFLSFREMFEAGLAGAYTNQYEEAGIELVCNTPEEILDLAVEVDERLQGKWQPQPEDEELQARFRGILRQYTPSDRRGEISVCLGSAFLRKHMYLLD
jgi:putative glycosyltransferase (TIGR04372 family)